MKFSSKYKVDPMFSTSSMTDIVFLLLVFFLLTSTVVTPSGIEVNLPKAASSGIVMQEITVVITEDLKYAINNEFIPENALDAVLESLLQGTNEKKVILYIDEYVPTKHFVKVSGIAKKYGASITIAVKPQ